METFVRLLKAEVQRSSYTEVAYHLGISDATLRRWLAGRRQPKGDAVLRAIAYYPAIREAIVPDSRVAV